MSRIAEIKRVLRESPEVAEAAAPEALLAKIAKDELDIDTLTTRNSDRLDFHDVAVWSVKKALQRAYDEGAKSKGKP